MPEFKQNIFWDGKFFKAFSALTGEYLFDFILIWNLYFMEVEECQSYCLC